MKLNTLLLTSAATVMATSVAFAADLPSKKAAPSAGSVQICKIAGKTGFQLPGSDTCVVLSGYVWAQAGSNPTALYGSKTRGVATENHDNYFADYRGEVDVDAYSNTEMGVLHSNFNIRATNGSFSSPQAFLELGGFKAGKYDSTFSAMDGGPTIGSGLDLTSSTTPIQVGYSAALGSGVTLGLALEVNKGKKGWNHLWGTAGSSNITNDYTTEDVNGTTYTKSYFSMSNRTDQKMPDVVATLDFTSGMVDVHLGGAFHNVAGSGTSYANDWDHYGITDDHFNRHLDNIPFLAYSVAGGSHSYDENGYAVDAAIKLHLDSLAKGDYLQIEGQYADGAVDRLADAGYSFLSNSANDFTNTAFVTYTGNDATISSVESHSTVGWDVAGVFHHVFSPKLSGNLFGSYESVEAGAAWVTTGNNIVDVDTTSTAKIVGANLDYEVVKNFHVKPEVVWLSISNENAKVDGATSYAVSTTETDDVIYSLRIQRDF